MNKRLSFGFVTLALTGFGLPAFAGPPSTAQPVDWTLLSRAVDRQVDGKWTAIFPEQVEKLAGRKIRLTGFVVGEVSARGHDILIGAHIPGCTCAICTTVASAMFADIHLTKSIASARGQLVVDGTLTLSRDCNGALYYSLKDAAVVMEYPSS